MTHRSRFRDILKFKTSGTAVASNDFDQNMQFIVDETSNALKYKKKDGSVVNLSGSGSTPPSLNNNNTIYFDVVNGNDTTGDGTEANKYKSLPKCLSFAASVYGSKQYIKGSGVGTSGDNGGTAINLPNTTGIKIFLDAKTICNTPMIMPAGCGNVEFYGEGSLEANFENDSSNFFIIKLAKINATITNNTSSNGSRIINVQDGTTASIINSGSGLLSIENPRILYSALNSGAGTTYIANAGQTLTPPTATSGNLIINKIENAVADSNGRSIIYTSIAGVFAFVDVNFLQADFATKGKIYQPSTSTNIVVYIGPCHSRNLAGDTIVAPVQVKNTDISEIGNGLSSALVSGKIYVGSGSGVATAVSVSGDATMTNAGVFSITNASVIGKVLTGFAAASSRAAIVATDSILAAFNKIQKYLNDLSIVAFSGSYNDLSNKPTIPAAQVNSDWSSSSGLSQILNKPSIPTVPSNVGAFTNDSNYQSLAAMKALFAGAIQLFPANSDFGIWTLLDGRALSRTTCSAIFGMFSFVLSGNINSITSNSATISAISSTANLRIGMVVECTGISGATIASIINSTSITIAFTAITGISNNSNISTRFFKKSTNNGDGSTTFNLPSSSGDLTVANSGMTNDFICTGV